MKIYSQIPQFPARIIRFRDGDTAQVEMNIGFDVIICRGFRLLGIESWELASAEGDRARAAAHALTELYKDREAVAHCSTRGFDCYGRLRGNLTVDGVNVADHIVTLGLAWHETRRERACTI